MERDAIALAAQEAPAESLAVRKRTEVVLCRLRYLMAALVLAMTVFFEPASLVGALALVAGPVALNAFVYRALPRIATLEEARRLGRAVLAADFLGAGATYLIFLGDPRAMPVAFMPFLVFQLSVRYGVPGIAAGLGLFALALAGRVYSQLFFLEGGTVRAPLIILWSSVALLMVAFSREFRAQEEARLAAWRERERIAAGFRATVAGVLERSGIRADAATRADVLRALQQVLDERADGYEALAARIADLLAAPGEDLGLSRREREILSLLARGYSYARIASTLFVSQSTVRNHVHNIKTKLGAGSREEIVQLARTRGLAR